MGAGVASHVVNGVHALTSSLEINSSVRVEVLHVAVSEVHEVFTLTQGGSKAGCSAFFHGKVFVECSGVIPEISHHNIVIR